MMANLQTYKASTLTCQLTLSIGNLSQLSLKRVPLQNIQGFEGSPLLCLPLTLCSLFVINISADNCLSCKLSILIWNSCSTVFDILNVFDMTPYL